MQDFIEWCNDNPGFVSALLTIMSIALSVIAIIVSIKVAKLPFKKKIAIAYYTNIGIGSNDGIEFFTVEATNIGNRIIKVSFVGIGFKKDCKWQKAYNIKKNNPTNEMLDINNTVVAEYDLDWVRKQKNIAYAIAVDIEGKVYKRRIK